MFNRIRLTLTLWYVGVLLGIVAIITSVTYAALYRSLASEVDDSLESSARQIAAQLSEESLTGIQPIRDSEGHQREDDGKGEDEGSENEHDEEDDRGVRFFGATSGDTFYLVLDPAGNPILDPLNVNLRGVPDAASASEAARERDAWKTFTSQGTEYRLYSRAVTDEERTIAVVQVGRSLEEHRDQLRTLLILLVATGASGLILAAAGGLFVAGRALRPVREGFSRQRAFVADASHELRTPLTLLRGNAELLQMQAGSTLSTEDSRALGEIIRQTGHMERLIGDMSTLARMDEGQLLLQLGPINVGELLRTAADDAAVLAAGKTLDIALEAEGDLHVIADETRIHEVLLALVDNAVRHAPDGGRIGLLARDLDSHVEVSVSDTGPGIPPQHIDRIFERFYRVDPSRSRQEGGSGLGLSIARAIAEAHGGTLTASCSEDSGATFTLRLSRSGPPSLLGN